MFQGRWPTGTVAVIFPEATSIAETEASPPFETNTTFPSGRTAIPLERLPAAMTAITSARAQRSEEHTSELQSQSNLVCRLLLEKKKKTTGRRQYSASVTPCPTGRHRAGAST